MQESLLMSPSLEDEAPAGVLFLGEVPTRGFINGTELASAIGLTRGAAFNTNEPWLHFELDGKTLYVAKKPFRYNLNWDHIHAQGAVYGSREIDILGDTYKVRLLKGADTDPTPAAIGWNPTGTSTSEWNRLIYNVHNGVHTDPGNRTPPGYWPLYSDADLVVYNDGGSGGYGSFSWCQETRINYPDQRVFRGNQGVSLLGFQGASHLAAIAIFGWRPVLELID